MRRRDFLKYATLTSLTARGLQAASVATPRPGRESRDQITLFVAGDVMTGRGIDQILPHPGDPLIHEPYSRSALDYLRLAERVNGPVPQPVAYDYIWGDALAVLEAAAPDVRLINLETAITGGGTPWPRKGIQYRMHPDNAPCLTAAAIDCCVLANNHVLDWGYAGFEETLATLKQNAIAGAGAGFDRKEARAPGILPVGEHGRVLVFAAGLRSSGIPPRWAATRDRPGVHLLPDLSEQSVGEVAAAVRAVRRPGDIVVVSLHWGGNWGYDIPLEHRRFACALIDAAGIDLIHGHSSHHPLGIEVYRGRPILYGCGDLIDDYEGISGHEAYRSDLALLYLVTLPRNSGDLERLAMIPMCRRRMRLNHADTADREWLRGTLDRECRRLGSRVVAAADGRLELRWD